MTAEKHRWVLSGGMASGKSRVRQLLEGRGVATIDADSIGHQILKGDGTAFAEVSARWPEVVVNGVISRSDLASIVFADSDELDALESITHPHIFGIIKDQVEDIDSTVVVEVPLLSHGLGREWRRIVVDCRDQVRLGRAVANGILERDAKARMARQPSRSAWLAAADLVVPNHGDVKKLEAAVSRLADVI